MSRGNNGTIHPVDKQVGENIKRLRHSRDVNQSELGNALGLTFQQVQKYEKEANRVSASKLHGIATFFKVDIGVFFDGTPSTTDPTQIVDAPAAGTYVDSRLRKAVDDIKRALRPLEALVRPDPN